MAFRQGGYQAWHLGRGVVKHGILAGGLSSMAFRQGVVKNGVVKHGI